MLSFVAAHSDEYDDLNDDIIRIREKEDIVHHLELLFRKVESDLSGFVSYQGVIFDDTHKKIRDINKGKQEKMSKKHRTALIGIDQTYARPAIFRFKLKYGAEITNFELPLYIPILYDRYHFMIRGNLYSAPFQMIDALTHTTKNAESVVLKTLTRPIKLGRQKMSIRDVHGDNYPVESFVVVMSKKKIPFLLFYFAEYGFTQSLDYFWVRDIIKFFDECPLEAEPEHCYFKFGQIYVQVPRAAMKDHVVQGYLGTLLASSKRGYDIETIQRVDRWKMILGSYMSQSLSYEKGCELVHSLISSLDSLTLKNVNVFTSNEVEKTTVFEVVRWMFIHYDTLVMKNSNILNKRLRMAEYLIAPIVRSIYTRVYRFQGYGKRKDIDKLGDIFKVSASSILDYIIGKTKTDKSGMSVSKYSGHVNDMKLFNVALSYTQSGPGSPLEDLGKNAGVHYRQTDPSYAGRVCLIDSSNGEPGIRGTLSPHARIDPDTLTFEP